MAWSEDFIEMTNEERLQELSTINDAMRALRRAVIDAQTVEGVLDLSTQEFAINWQGDLNEDVDKGTNGQIINIEAKAQTLESYFATS